MTCQTYAEAVVCSSPRGIYKRLMRECWTCEKETRFVALWHGGYYGVSIHCLECGDQWMDGERAERPFYRYWKRDRIREHQAMWDNTLSDEAWEAYMRADIQWVFARTKKEQAKATAAMNRVARLIAKERAA